MFTVPRTSVQTCPGCGRPIRRPRQAPRPPADVAVDTARLSDREVYRYFHRIAPVADLRSFLRHARLSADLRADAEALLALGCRDTGGTLTRADWYRRLTALQDRWRRESADAVTITPDLMAEAV
jgi:hypothetical protein